MNAPAGTRAAGPRGSNRARDARAPRAPFSFRRLWAIARKETLHIRRDPRSLGLAVGIPMLMILLFGYALTLDVDQVPMVAWDQSNTPASRAYLAQFSHSRYFSLQGTIDNYRELERMIDDRRAWLGLVIPSDFAQELEAGRPVAVQAIVDGSDSNTAGFVLSYAQGITLGYNGQVALTQRQRLVGTTGPAAALELRPRVWFNADLESKNYIIPGIIAVIMGLIAALLTSLTVAREWENGTMEQLISTPVRPPELILGKLLPYFAIGLFDVLIAVLMAVYLFDVPLRGSVPLLFGVAALFMIGTLAQGILISTLARQQLLASQLAMVSTFLPAFLLSGFTFAIANMPLPVQVITHIVPARYFVTLVKGLFLRGVGLEALWRDALFLLVFALIVAGLAIARFRKRLG
ncbi:ABC transporter permease [Opitutus terrae]|uniref:ABC-2 type transporter n=1 Tax=Opitutus terrae (strain DSM 11246 / JCM 15787 / PB90-1) TaxID=452637 RepID=B1ZWT0_OPITP|nr:ABC transporter permease [Opitutus terrae]ACB74207.1 ABC-2 type transporter [Opitutus terrae PB90-1]